MKRAFDITVAGLLLVLLSPFLAVLALLVRWRLGTPVFFRQTRPGLYGAPFLMLKFRTMTDQRDDNGELLPDAERLTRFGRFLRSSSLDELPELWNVLKGEMSLVGPRPLLMEYLPFYTAQERRRHTVRPGITGWSQINGRNAARWNERLASDVWYVDNRNLRLDLFILAKTIKKTIWKEGLISDPRSAMEDLDVERANILRVERLEPSDAAEIANLIRSSYDLEDFSHTIIASCKFGKYLEDASFRNDVFFGAFRKGKLVGVLQAREFSDRVHLNNIAVVEDERGRGTAKALMIALFDIAEDRETDLLVDSRNEPALRFYERLGYREKSREDFSRYTSNPNGRKPKIPHAFTIENQNYLDKYGFCRLSRGNGEAQIGFIAPDNFSLGAEANCEDLNALLRTNGKLNITFPSELGSCLPADSAIVRWQRIGMVRTDKVETRPITPAGQSNG